MICPLSNYNYEILIDACTGMRYIASWFEVFAIEASSGCTSVVTRAECARIRRNALHLRWLILTMHAHPRISICLVTVFIR